MSFIGVNLTNSPEDLGKSRGYDILYIPQEIEKVLFRGLFEFRNVGFVILIAVVETGCTVLSTMPLYILHSLGETQRHG